MRLPLICAGRHGASVPGQAASPKRSLAAVRAGGLVRIEVNLDSHPTRQLGKMTVWPGVPGGENKRKRMRPPAQKGMQGLGLVEPPHVR